MGYNGKKKPYNIYVRKIRIDEKSKTSALPLITNKTVETIPFYCKKIIFLRNCLLAFSTEEMRF